MGNVFRGVRGTIRSDRARKDGKSTTKQSKSNRRKSEQRRNIIDYTICLVGGHVSGKYRFRTFYSLPTESLKRKNGSAVDEYRRFTEQIRRVRFPKDYEPSKDRIDGWIRYELLRDGQVHAQHIVEIPAGLSERSNVVVRSIGEANLALLFYDVSNKKTFDSLKEWIDIVRMAGNSSKQGHRAVIIGTKDDLSRRPRQIPKSVARATAEKYGWDLFEVSLEDRSAVNRALHEISKTIGFAEDLAFRLRAFADKR